MAAEGKPPAEEPAPYKLQLGMIVLASAVSKCILLQGLAVDSLAALCVVWSHFDQGLTSVRLSSSDALQQVSCRSHLSLTPAALAAADACRDLTGNQGVSTIPMACSQVGNVLASVPAARLMARCGRRIGFAVGAGLFVAGGLLGALAMSSRSFALQLVAVWLTGMGIGFAEYLRFAAAEVVPPALKPRAIALSVAGSILSAFVGPEVAKATRSLMSIEFQASYLANAGIAVVYLCLILSIPGLPNAAPPAPPKQSDDGDRSKQKGRCCSCGAGGSDSAVAIYLRTPALVVATLSSAIGFGSMILSMTATPLAMKAEGKEGKQHLFLEFSLCLSRACLGKIMHFIYKWLKKCRFLMKPCKPRTHDLSIWVLPRVGNESD
jgi:MFS family permease